MSVILSRCWTSDAYVNSTFPETLESLSAFLMVAKTNEMLSGVDRWPCCHGVSAHSLTATMWIVRPSWIRVWVQEKCDNVIHTGLQAARGWCVDSVCGHWTDIGGGEEQLAAALLATRWKDPSKGGFESGCRLSGHHSR